MNDILHTAIQIVLCGIGGVIGLTLADIDLAPPLPISHRSFWTHSPAIPLALWWWLENQNANEHLFWLALGFLPGFALHLAYDMFPKSWHGSARISLRPLPGRLPASLSFLYLILGMIVGLAAAAWLVNDLLSAIILIVITTMLTGAYKKREAGGWPPPLNRLRFLRKAGDLPPLVVYWSSVCFVLSAAIVVR
jgi:hypothetical protein